MTEPTAMIVYPGGDVPDWQQRQRIVQWLSDNGIDPKAVTLDPVYVLAVPSGRLGEDGKPQLIDVIVFTQHYVNPDGFKEFNLLAKKAVTFQRTVPLQVPYHPAPTEDRQPPEEEVAGA